MLPVDIMYNAMIENHAKLKEDWEIIQDVLNLDVSYVRLLEDELKIRKDYTEELRIALIDIRRLENEVESK